MSKVSDAWKRIEAWYEAQGISDFLNPGITPEALERAKTEYALDLPADLLESLQRHNGSQLLSGWPGGELLSLEEMVSHWAMLSSALDDEDETDEEADEYGNHPYNLINSGLGGSKVKPGWWHDGWLPVVANYGKIFLLVDLDPAPEGTVGQVIGFSSDGGPTGVLVPTFTAYLESIANDLESGDVYVEDTDVLGSTWD